ncbi:hypothetical protein CDD81_6255 [Ophiocordyceps australis]|uniref:Uncharacterized protein n=1 Tax=Ophiocordyceps australis TaxID=1399860 RepID=A0A2C5Y820_9HYPO|nr:hypothetical protein CDD81_6255 [Ophiocordyceps australis]
MTMEEDIRSLIRRAEQCRDATWTDHAGEAQSRVPYPVVLNLSEPRRLPQPCSEPDETSSSSSGATRQSRLFDAHDYETCFSASTSDPPQYVLEMVPAVQQPLPAADPSPPCLPCDFVVLSGCRQRFRLSQVDDWINHVINVHLDAQLPRNSICWFCDGPPFVALSKGPEHRADAFRSRMQHIAQHFRDGQTAAQVRPDYRFLDHVRRSGLVSDDGFQMATQKDDDLPLPRNMTLVTHATTPKPARECGKLARQLRPRSRAPSPRRRMS